MSQDIFKIRPCDCSIINYLPMGKSAHGVERPCPGCPSVTRTCKLGMFVGLYPTILVEESPLSDFLDEALARLLVTLLEVTPGFADGCRSCFSRSSSETRDERTR